MRRASLSFLLVLALTAVNLAAQQSPPALTIAKISAPTPNGVAKLNEPLDIRLDNLEGPNVKERRDPSKFKLYLNGYEVPKLAPVLDGRDTLRFMLSRDDDTKKVWSAILGAPTASRTNVDVGLRYDGNIVEPGKGVQTKIPFRVLVPWIAIFWLVIVAALIVLFCVAARFTNIIRDTVPPKPPTGQKRPYSLARAQMAWWFLVILPSFIFIFAITGDWGTINTEALILMGIGTGTALGATIIDVSKQNNAARSLADLTVQEAKANAELTQQTAALAALKAALPAAPTAADLKAVGDAEIALAEKKAALAKVTDDLAAATAALSSPVSKNFVDDLLTDANGANVHRFQMVGWTVVLGIIYFYGVWKTLALPDFNATLNALLGISAGTYLGFKIPEKQA
jgi:hypothetical protein